jgi:plasmid maintenance system antidote protein VapI
MNLKKGRDKQGQLIQSKNHPHPGTFLLKEVVNRGISQAEAARLMGMFPHHFNEITRGKRGISIPIALRLEKNLWT